MSEFNFEKLSELFAKICPDYGAEPSFENATVSRRFAERVIFEYSKQAKEAKAHKKDKVWELKLNTTRAQGEKLEHTLIITMHNATAPPKVQPFLLHGFLQLTFKQASLLAVAKYCQIVPYLVERNEIVLTPLAGAVFAKDDMPKLAKALGEPLSEVVMAVISSCQSDGYYLEHSRCHITVAALAKTVADLKMRAALIKSNIKMYEKVGKSFDMNKFKICSDFLQSGRKAKCTISSKPDEVDQLVCEILSFNLTSASDSERRCPSKPKKTLKCGAKFSGPFK